MVLYRWLDDDASGWEYFYSSVHMLWQLDASSCLPFDPFPLCFLRLIRVSFVRRWMHIIIKGWWCEWMRVLLQFGAHAMAIRCFQLPPLRPFPFVFSPFDSCLLCQKMDTYNQGNQWAESKLGRMPPTQQLDRHWARCPWDHWYLCPVTVSGVCLLCQLVFWYIHADTNIMSTVCLYILHVLEKFDGIPGLPYTSCGQLRRDEVKTIKCHSMVDTDYSFWCQVTILDFW